MCRRRCNLFCHLFLNESCVLLPFTPIVDCIFTAEDGFNCTQELQHKVTGDTVCCFISGYTRRKGLSWTTWPTRTWSTRTTWTAWCYQHTRGHSTYSRRERKHGSNSLCENIFYFNILPQRNVFYQWNSVHKHLVMI